jgi:NAD(P)-dependent dehydrogenase (short-subunit alcohol dehydrogenase family)
MRDINETEIRMYSLICSNDGIKARDIARKVGVEKADINRLLYNAPFIHELCYRDTDFNWHGLIRQAHPHTGLGDFCGYYGSGANGIGKCIADEFRKAGVKVFVIDTADGDHFVGDISKKEVLEAFAKKVVNECGIIDYLINNAPPIMKGIDDCSYEEFQEALSVGVTAPFYLSKLLAPHFAKGASIVNISSSRDRMSQPQTESYTAAKGGIAALTYAMTVSFAGKVRVNSISPGWIDNAYHVYDGPDALQQPAGRVGNPMDIANMVMFLCSDKAGFITGENICIDGGMTKLMIYHDDHGWKYEP